MLTWLSFFEKEVPYSETVVAHHGHQVIWLYIISPPIVDVIMNRMLIQDDVETKTHSFPALLTESDEGAWYLRIEKEEKFEVVLSNVAMGLCFWQMASVAELTRTFGHVSNMTGLYEGFVSQMIQAVVDVNLQKLSTVVNETGWWAYSISFDAGTNRGTLLLTSVSAYVSKLYAELLRKKLISVVADGACTKTRRL